MGNLTKYFNREELLPEGFDDDSVLDPNLLTLIDAVRELLGVPCKINNWHKGGGRQWCGYRSSECTIGAPKSQHRKGKAADLHPEGMSAEDARAKVKEAVAYGLLPELGGVELGVSWLHLDTRPRVNGKVLWFNA